MICANCPFHAVDSNGQTCTLCNDDYRPLDVQIKCPASFDDFRLINYARLLFGGDLVFGRTSEA